MGELSKLPNIGKAMEAQLIQVGIETPEALRQVGAKAAWLKIQEIDPSPAGIGGRDSRCEENRSAGRGEGRPESVLSGAQAIKKEPQKSDSHLHPNIFSLPYLCRHVHSQFQYLSEKGYLAQRRYANIESLIIKATAQRNRKDTD